MVAVSPSTTADTSPKSKRPISKKEALPIDKIRVDGGTQARVKPIDEATVKRYVRAKKRGAQFPSILVYFDGTDYWCADGYQRLESDRRLGRTTIKAEIREGTLDDAILYCVGANDRHGLPRSNADKHHAVEMLLANPEWSKWSDREIARQCRVSHPFVTKIREAGSGNISRSRTFAKGGGSASTMDTSGISESNKSRASAPADPVTGELPMPTPVMIELFDADGDGGIMIHQAGEDETLTTCGIPVIVLSTKLPERETRLRVRCEKCYSPTAAVAPAAVQVAPLRFQPGMAAGCRHCDMIYHEAKFVYPFADWTLEPSGGIWRCPHKHRVADVLMKIAPTALPAPSAAPVEQPAAAPVSAPAPLVTEDGVILKYRPSDRAMCNQCNDWRHFIQVLPGGDLWQCKECSRQMRDDMMLLWTPDEAAARDERNARWPRSTPSTSGPSNPVSLDIKPASTFIPGSGKLDTPPAEPAATDPAPVALSYYAPAKDENSDERYTPEDILKLVIATLGAIDLDPCSNPGTPNVPAAVHYTKDDDGLSKPWKGRVWLNPPWHNTPMQDWISKLLIAYNAGSVTQAIALLPDSTGSEWFQQIAAVSRFCLIRGRLKFLAPNPAAKEAGQPPIIKLGSAPFYSVAFYLGGVAGDMIFTRHFKDLGLICRKTTNS